MLKKLILLILYLQIIRCAHICKEDGLFENSDDKTSYFECIDGKSYFRGCPLAEDGESYKVFNGQTCINSYPTFVCPQVSGKYRDLNNEHQYYECVNSEPLLSDCPQNTTFDGLECVLSSTPQNESELIKDSFKCPEPNGLFYNPGDKHSYYECKDSEFSIKYCPRERNGHRITYHKHNYKKRGVFDGQKCVHTHHHKPKDNRQSRQAPPDIAPEFRFTCPEPDGYFADPRDPHNYFICSADNPRLERCPPNRRFNDTIKQCTFAPTYRVGPDVSNLPQTYPIIDNYPLVEPYRPGLEPRPVVEPICPEGSVYDSGINKCRMESSADIRPVVVDLPTEPQCPSGSTYDSGTGRCVSYTNPIVNQPTCSQGSIYDSNSGRCVSYVDPIVNPRPVYVNRTCPSGSTYESRTGRCVSYVDPIANRPLCPLGSTYDLNTRGCVGGRYRRNGRVETEDTYNGAVIVDTWNEKEWKWERNPNGNRILPDVNGWLDRSFALRRGTRNQNMFDSV